MLIKRARFQMEEYINKVITSHLRINVDDKSLDHYVDMANRLYPDKTDTEVADIIPIKFDSDIKKNINSAVNKVNLDITLYDKGK